MRTSCLLDVPVCLRDGTAVVPFTDIINPKPILLRSLVGPESQGIPFAHTLDDNKKQAADPSLQAQLEAKTALKAIFG